MRRLPFEPPTNHYDERISSIDEQICGLIKQRKNLSGNNPGFPLDEYISKWAKRYGLYEDLLNTLFGILREEEDFRPRVEPTLFQKYIPLSKSVINGECIFSVPCIRQYENASVINFYIEWDYTKDLDEGYSHRHTFWELQIDGTYDCRMDSGSGSEGQFSYRYIVSPPLPEDLSEMQLVFREYEGPHREKPTGREVVVDLNGSNVNGEQSG